MAEALYRKYRPQIFEDVVGQEHIERTIKNAIEQDKVSHAYLFTGPRGTGKTTTARLLAKALLCEHGPTPEPDGTCDDCEMIAAGTHPDVYELDAASRTGVENVREEIIGRVQFAPTRGRYKIYIIDEVHMLSTAAFNALLKTLEEPPNHVVFILATTDPQKVPETIHSRCQRFDFRRIALESIVSRLGAICVAEDVEFEGEALDLIAHRAEGGMRNALTSLEQLIAFGEGKVTLEVAERMLGAIDTDDLAEIVRAIGMRDVASCFRWTAEYIETGADLAQFTRDLAEHVRTMYVMTLAGADVALEVGDATRRELAQELSWFGSDRLARLLGVLGDLTAELKTSTNQRLSFEIALTRMVRPDSDLTLESLAERVEALESGYSAVAHVSGAPTPTAAKRRPPVASEASSAAPSREEAACAFAAPAEPVVDYAQDAPDELREQHLTARDSSPDALRAAPAAVQSGVDGAPPASALPTQPPARAEAEVGVSAASPAGGTAPAPSPDLAASLQNPAALQRIWQGALSALKKSKAAYGVLFLNTKAVFDAEKNMLAIEFPTENTFAFKAVQKPDVQDAVSAALERACGVALPFIYMQGPQGTAKTAGGQTAPTSGRPPASPPSAPSPTSAPTASLNESRSSFEPPPAQAPAKPVVDDEMPPYDDEAPPDDDEGGKVAPAAATRQPPRAAMPDARPPESPQSRTAPEPGANLGAEPDGRCAPAPKTPTSPAPENIEAVLAAGFGEGIVFEEVQE